MTETTETTAAPETNGTAAPARKAGGLSSMLLPELKQVAGGLGIKATGMKKAELVAAIKAAQGGGQGGQGGGKGGAARADTERAPRREQERQPDARQDGARQDGARHDGA